MSVQTLDHVLATGRGIERSFCCPVHGDSHASASVNVVKGVWVCYACHAHGAVGEARIPEIEQIVEILVGSVKPRVYPESWLDLFDAHYPSAYWVGRFGREVAEANRCGTDPLSGAATYPMRSPKGEVWGVVARANGTPKYKYPYGVSAAMTLFGDLGQADVVVLVEGAADVMALQQEGIPENWRVLGCYGAGVHYPQLQLVFDCGPHVIVAAFDDDDAGRNATQRAESQLGEFVPVVSHPWSSIGAKDPGEAPLGTRVDSIRNTLTQTQHAKYA